MWTTVVKLAILPVVVVVGACSSSGEPGPGAPASGDPATPPAAAVESALTYHEHVKPLLDEHCVQCHTQGGIAPFPLTTFEEVTKHAAAIRAAVESRIMPPWPAAPGCTDYTNDISLKDDQIATISKWVASGAPAGDAKAPSPPSAPTTAHLARVDLKIGLDSFTPSKSPDEYRCFVVDWAPTTTKFVTGMDVRPGDPRIVHHVLAYVATPAQVPAIAALDAADPGPGYACFAGPGAIVSQIGGWVPGSAAMEFPAGTGVEVQPGSKVVVQLHYNTSATPPGPDASTVELTLADSVATKAALLSFLNPDWPTKHTMSIPPRTADAVQRYSADPLPLFNYLSNGLIKIDKPLTVHWTSAHMHTHGTKETVAVERANGQKECMLDIPRWNFHWQRFYALATPKTLQPGDKMSIECHWDNHGESAMNWGENTSDEMCMTFAYVTQP